MCGHAVYTVEETEVVELPHPSVRKEASTTDTYNERCARGSPSRAGTAACARPRPLRGA